MDTVTLLDTLTIRSYNTKYIYINSYTLVVGGFGKQSVKLMKSKVELFKIIIIHGLGLTWEAKCEAEEE